MHTGKLSNTLENHWLYCLGRVGCRDFSIYFIYFSVFIIKHVEDFRIDSSHGSHFNHLHRLLNLKIQ
jgi:hypothetical protein